jgi:hypothetical protein
MRERIKRWDEGGVKRQSVRASKRRDRQMRNRLNASDLVRRSRCPRFACKAKQNQRRRQEIFSRMSVDSEQRMAREGTHENGGFP